MNGKTRTKSVLLIAAALLVAATGAAEAKKRCADALDIWRGDPFGVLHDEEFVLVEAHRLEELRHEAVELRLEAEIALGDCDAAIGHLEAAVEDDPYRERLWYLLMLALAKTGRRVEAVRAYQRVREILAESGLEPAEELRLLEGDIVVEAPAVHAHLPRAN